jgi:uncharacterized protein (DUF885 family)
MRFISIPRTDPMPRPLLRAGAILFTLAGSSIATAADDANGPPGLRLRAAFAAYWSDQIRTHPLEATFFVGDHRGDDRLDDLSLDAYMAWLGRLRASRKGIEAIDPARLTPDERTDREILLGVIDDRLAVEPFGDHQIPLAQLTRYSTDLHFPDQHLLYAQLAELHPASTVGDLENFLRRLRAAPFMADALIAVMRRGLAERRVPPRVSMARVVPQLRSLAVRRAEESPLWTIAGRLPADWTEADRKALLDRVRTALERDVATAFARLADFVETEYLPACRESVGLCNTPDGALHYAQLVRSYTTTDLAPDRIHEIGLAELDKTRSAMEAIRRKVGFDGDLKAFFAHLRGDPKLQNRGEPEILDRHRAIVREMESALPRLFGRLSSVPCDVRPFDPIRARSSPSAEYYPAPSDGSRPGIFFVNTSDPTSRPTYTMQALAYHEAVPGHHLQAGLALEAPGRPAFRRHLYIPAFDEGWALYAEGLPAELGLYRDPYSELGRLTNDAWRCARLVIDTGLHARHWDRDRAIAFLEANTALPRGEVENEVDRYIAWPGQALAYKLGELKIRELRSATERRLGKDFDLRAFHDRMLSFGSVPLRVLERLMDAAPPSTNSGRGGP